MTGFIHGEVSWSDRAEPVLGSVERMLDALGRYPWASSSLAMVAREPACALGSQELSSSTRRTTRTTPQDDATVHVVADIQLHARDELAQQVGLSTTDAASLTDTDLLRHAYRRWGIGCAERLHADGAFAIWDAPARRLLCWRDPAGVRPL